MKITLLAGSNRKNATSTMACKYIRRYLERRGHEITWIDLYEAQLPFYSPDIEEYHPTVQHMLQAIDEAKGILLSTPEYHGSISGVLKNALDYVGDEMEGKSVMGVSSSGGAVGVSSLTHLQTIVRNLHGIFSPEWVSIGGENRKFNADGEPQFEKVQTRIDRAIDTWICLIEKLK